MKKYLYYLLPLLFPVIFLIYFYISAMQTGLPGRRGGPQDAFRHSYASAVVARYTHSNVVKILTNILESNSEDSYDLMDRHNNAIGAKIGSSDLPIYETLLNKIKQGSVSAYDKNTLMWLPSDHWSNGF